MSSRTPKSGSKSGSAKASPSQPPNRYPTRQNRGMKIAFSPSEDAKTQPPGKRSVGTASGKAKTVVPKKATAASTATAAGIDTNQRQSHQEDEEENYNQYDLDNDDDEEEDNDWNDEDEDLDEENDEENLDEDDDDDGEDDEDDDEQGFNHRFSAAPRGHYDERIAEESDSSSDASKESVKERKHVVLTKKVRRELLQMGFKVCDIESIEDVISQLPLQGGTVSSVSVDFNAMMSRGNKNDGRDHLSHYWNKPAQLLLGILVISTEVLMKMFNFSATSSFPVSSEVERVLRGAVENHFRSHALADQYCTLIKSLISSVIAVRGTHQDSNAFAPHVFSLVSMLNQKLQYQATRGLNRPARQQFINALKKESSKGQDFYTSLAAKSEAKVVKANPRRVYPPSRNFGGRNRETRSFPRQRPSQLGKRGRNEQDVRRGNRKRY